MARTRKSEEYQKFYSHITGRQDFSPQRVRPSVKSNQKEIGRNGVCAECLRYLKSLEAYYPCKAERMATGAGMSPVGRILRYGTKGRADIYFVLGGKIFYIETKGGSGGYLSTYQMQFKNAVEAAGAIYLTVCSKAELKEKMQPFLDMCPKLPGVADFDNDPELKINLMENEK